MVASTPFSSLSRLGEEPDSPFGELKEDDKGGCADGGVDAVGDEDKDEDVDIDGIADGVGDGVMEVLAAESSDPLVARAAAIFIGRWPLPAGSLRLL